MVEPLLHFVVPFVSLRAVGVDLRKTTFASVIALTPDLDVVFNTHRSPTHSVVVLGLVLLSFLALTWKRKTAPAISVAGCVWRVLSPPVRSLSDVHASILAALESAPLALAES